MLPLGYGAKHNKGTATYSQIAGPSGYLATLKPFAGNSMSADWEGEAYVVYSYNTEIAIVHVAHDGTVLLKDWNLAQYSPTTSHHQNLALAWLPDLGSKVA